MLAWWFTVAASAAKAARESGLLTRHLLRPHQPGPTQIILKEEDPEKIAICKDGNLIKGLVPARANTTWPLHKETHVLTELEPHKHTSPYIIPCKRVYLPSHQQFSAQGCRSGSKITKRKKFKSTRGIALDLRSWPALPEDLHGSCLWLQFWGIQYLLAPSDTHMCGIYSYRHIQYKK